MCRVVWTGARSAGLEEEEVDAVSALICALPDGAAAGLCEGRCRGWGLALLRPQAKPGGVVLERLDQHIRSD